MQAELSTLRFMPAFIVHLKFYDWILMGAVLILIAIGIITLFSLAEVSPTPFFKKQLLWSGIGLLFLILVSLVDFRMFRTQSAAVFLLYVFSVTLLVAVILSGFTVRGVEAWLRAGKVFFQPVELAKLVIVIVLAKFFSKRHIEIFRVQHLLVSAFYVAIPAVLVLLQPDLGSTIVLGAIWVAIVVFSGIKIRHFFMLIFLVVVMAFAGWSFLLAPYQKERVTAFLNPYADPQGAGYQMIQSLIAVGSGQLWGKGLGYGSQSHLHFLPEAETDFIFAAFAEEWGFVGIIVLLSLLLIILWRVIWIGIRSDDNFSRLYALGFAALIFTQSFIHIGMNMGVMPITGLTLPFVSYGGSSLVSLLIGIGILQNIKIYSRLKIE